jgi:hypothetical protein
LITDSLLIFNNFASLIKRVERVEGVEGEMGPPSPRLRWIKGDGEKT